MVSKELPTILEWWRSPLWMASSINIKSKGVQPVMEEFTFLCVVDVIEKELQGIQELTMCPPDKVPDGGLTHFLTKDMVLKLSSLIPSSTPKLWALLQKLSQTIKQARKHTKKPSDLMGLCSSIYWM